MPPLLLNKHLGAVAFVRPDVILLDRLQHGSQAFLDFPRIVACTVPRKEEFKHKRRNIRALLNLQQEILANHFSREHLVQLLVERIGFRSR